MNEVADFIEPEPLGFPGGSQGGGGRTIVQTPSPNPVSVGPVRPPVASPEGPQRDLPGLVDPPKIPWAWIAFGVVGVGLLIWGIVMWVLPGGVKPTPPRTVVLNVAWASSVDPLGQKVETGGITPLELTLEPNRSGVTSIMIDKQFIDSLGNTFEPSINLAIQAACQAAGVPQTKWAVRARLLEAGAIDGPSAGALIAGATLALIKGDEIRKDVTITGALNPDGSTARVGGVVSKMRGAKAAGVRLFGYPPGIFKISGSSSTQTGAAENILEEARRMDLEVRAVDSIVSAYELLTGKTFPEPAKLRSIETIDAQMRAELANRYDGEKRKFDSRVERSITGWVRVFDELKQDVGAEERYDREKEGELSWPSRYYFLARLFAYEAKPLMDDSQALRAAAMASSDSDPASAYFLQHLALTYLEQGSRKILAIQELHNLCKNNADKIDDLLGVLKAIGGGEEVVDGLRRSALTLTRTPNADAQAMGLRYLAEIAHLNSASAVGQQRLTQFQSEIVPGLQQSDRERVLRDFLGDLIRLQTTVAAQTDVLNETGGSIMSAARSPGIRTPEQWDVMARTFLSSGKATIGLWENLPWPRTSLARNRIPYTVANSIMLQASSKLQQVSRRLGVGAATLDEQTEALAYAMEGFVNATQLFEVDGNISTYIGVARNAALRAMNQCESNVGFVPELSLYHFKLAEVLSSPISVPRHEGTFKNESGRRETKDPRTINVGSQLVLEHYQRASLWAYLFASVPPEASPAKKK